MGGAFLVPGTVWSTGVNSMNTELPVPSRPGPRSCSEHSVETAETSGLPASSSQSGRSCEYLQARARAGGADREGAGSHRPLAHFPWITQSTRQKSLENKPLAVLATDGQIKMDRYCQQRK